MDDEEMIGCRVVALEGDNLYGVQGLVLEADDGTRYIAFPHTLYEDSEIICEREDKVYRGRNGYPSVGG